MLDCGSELYMWIGKKSSSGLRSLVEEILIGRIFPLNPNRPDFIVTAKLMEGVEPEVFKVGPSLGVLHPHLVSSTLGDKTLIFIS